MQNSRIKFNILLLLSAMLMAISACKKDWLDAKPSKALVVPGRIEDYQKLLDNNSQYNTISMGLGEIASDTYFAPYDLWQSGDVIEQHTYLWDKDPFQGSEILTWNQSYKSIFQDNLVLEGAGRLADGNANNPNWKNIKGTALFYRGYDQYTLSQLFCKPYDAATAAADLGIPIKLVADVNEQSIRSTLAQTYLQILSDLKASITLLPLTPLYKTRPSKPAAYGMLSRVYLSMGDYENTYRYADSCLLLYNKLLDYTTLNTAATRPFARYNDEVILDWGLDAFGIFFNGRVDTTLYSSYDSDDLRKALFFNQSTFIFKGSYRGSIIPFNGLAVDEIYLNRSESAARLGLLDRAKSDLNTLLATRFKAGTYIPLAATGAEVVLSAVLRERKKELLFRGLRWTDLRRLNKDPRFAITLTRNLNGQQYTLPPNDPRYVFPIPQNEIVASGIPQNPR